MYVPEVAEALKKYNTKSVILVGIEVSKKKKKKRNRYIFVRKEPVSLSLTHTRLSK